MKEKVMDQDLKESLECMYAICDEVEKTLGAKLHLRYPLKTLLKTEWMVFIMHLSFSDLKIHPEEKGFLYDSLGFRFSDEEMEAFMAEIDLEHFATTIPYTLQVFVQADNHLFSKYGKISLAATVLYEVYETLGLAAVSVDGEINIQEYNDLFSYLRMLSTYMNRNLLSLQNHQTQ